MTNGVRRSFVLVLLLASLSSIAACGTSTRREGNGLRGELTFIENGEGAVGAPHVVEILDGYVNSSDCSWRRGSYGIPDVSCTTWSVPVVEVTEVTCTGAGCTVESVDIGTYSGRVVLRTTSAGTARLSVRVRLEDGRERADEIDLAFVEVAEIRLACTEPELGVTAETCPGRYGTFVGARWGLSASAYAAGDVGPLDVDVAIREEGGAVGLTPATDRWNTLDARAIAGGSSRLHATAGGVERVLTVRVATAADVVSLAVRDLRLTADDDDPEAVLLGSSGIPATTPPRGPTDLFVVVSTLADGTEVLGGRATVVSDDPGILDPELYDHTPTDGFWTFRLYPYGLTGTVDITTTLGSVSTTSRVEVVP